MADVPVTVQVISRSGITPTYAGSLSTSNVYQVPNNGKVFLQFKKAQATDCTVTFRTQGTVDGQAVADRTGTVPASTGDKLFGPFPTSVYGRTLEVTLSNIDGLTMAAFRLAED